MLYEVITPKARLAIQDEEDVRGEVIYPSVGMVICLHPDVAYRRAEAGERGRFTGLVDRERPAGRMVAVMGDAELDEGNIFV